MTYLNVLSKNVSINNIKCVLEEMDFEQNIEIEKCIKKFYKL